MAETTYTYTISTDITAGQVSSTRLAQEIGLSSIVTALERIDTAGDALDVVFKAALSAADKTTLDGDATGPSGGLIGAHTGEPLPSPPVTASGAPVVAPTFQDSEGEDPEWQGYEYNPTASDGVTPTLSVWDEVVTVEKKIHAGSYRIIPPTTGTVPTADIIEFSVVDKDDTLGLFTALGLTVGVDVLELQKYVRDEHVDGNARNERIFSSGGVFPIVPGLYMRTGYTSTGTDVPTLFVTINDYME